MNYYSRFGEFIFSEPRGRYRRLFMAAVLDPSRRFPSRAGRRGARAAWPGRHGDGPSLRRIHAGRRRRHRAFRRTRRAASCRTCAARSRSAARAFHSAIRQATFPERGAAGLSRRQHVARGVALEAVPERRHHGAGRLARRRQDGDLPDLSKEPDADGMMLINWVAELQTSRDMLADWNLAGRIEDIYPTYASWHFDWLDVAGMIRKPGDRAGVPDGGPRSAAVLDGGARHARWRRRASDVSARRQRRQPGDPRRPRAGPLHQGGGRSARGAEGLRGGAAEGGERRGAAEPRGAARRHPQGGA